MLKDTRESRLKGTKISEPFGYDVYHRFKGESDAARVDTNRMVE